MIEFIFKFIAEIYCFALKVGTWLFVTEQTLPEISAVGGCIVAMVVPWIANFVLKKLKVRGKWLDIVSTIASSLSTIALTVVIYHFEHINEWALATIILAIISIGLFGIRKFIENWSDETYRSNAEACY